LQIAAYQNFRPMKKWLNIENSGIDNAKAKENSGEGEDR
jgi:hypothetical protein